MAYSYGGLSRRAFLKLAGGTALSLLLMSPALRSSAGQHPPPARRRASLSSAQSFETEIQRGVDYLWDQFSVRVQLLRESPTLFPDKYWVFNDNAIAAHVLETLGQQQKANTLFASIQSYYGRLTNGRQEVLWGIPIDWPPRLERQVRLQDGDPEDIWLEICDDDQRYLDWMDFANLEMLGALNELLAGAQGSAASMYESALRKFDGYGFCDKAFEGAYETYKVALALHIGLCIGSLTQDMSDTFAGLLLQQQATSGGFWTHYYPENGALVPRGDTNTETTSLAILGLHSYRPPAPATPSATWTPTATPGPTPSPTSTPKPTTPPSPIPTPPANHRVFLPLICRDGSGR